MMKPSKHHKNRRSHNWLMYNIGDRFLTENAPLYKGDLYDLGCGEAPYKDFFLAYARTYTGVDWSESQHNTNTDITADLNKSFPIASEVADTIVSLSVMEHLCEPQNFLNEAYRILRKDGTIILQVPWQWWIHEAPHDFFRYTPHGLKYMFEKAGFAHMEIKPQSGFFTMWLMKFNYFSKRAIRGPKIIKVILKTALTPIWFINQLIAPALDKIDKDWNLDATGYQVIARKTK